jgi:hypothetical protein
MDKKKSTSNATLPATTLSKITLLDLTERERSKVLKANRGLLARTQRRLAAEGATVTLSGIAKAFARGRRSNEVMLALSDELALMILERERAEQELEERRRKARGVIARLTKSA